MGTVTFAAYLAPITPFDESDGAVNRNNQLLEVFQIILVISALLSFVCILLCSTFHVAISIFLVSDEDLVWFGLPSLYHRFCVGLTLFWQFSQEFHRSVL